MNRIHDSLQAIFRRHRLVFWYDPTGEWKDAYETFVDPAITKVQVAGNEFGVKVTIHRNPDHDARYLLYFPTARPSDNDNWLLDLLMQGHEYKADRASLALQEAGVPYEFLPVINEHVWVFNAERRASAFRELYKPGDEARAIRLKMMAAITGSAPEIDALLLWFLKQVPPEGMVLVS